MYEITRLINHVIGGNENRRREIVENLGYKDDIYRGYSRLRGLMQTGKCDSDMKENLSEALGIDKKFVEEAFLKTDIKINKQKDIHEAKKQQVEEKRFKPYLWIEHEYDHIIAKSYDNLNGYKEIKTLALPEHISSMDWDEQLKVIRKYINMNQKSSTDNRFGKVSNYVYFRSPSESYLFDIYGGFIRTKPQHEPKLQYAAG